MTLRRPPWEEDPIEYLVSRKFPRLIKPMPLRPLASNNPSPIGPDRQILDQAEAYREELRALSASGLQTLVGEARREDARRENQRAEAEERKRFFNQSEAKADFVHWASASYWTLDETTALSLGKDPRVVSWSLVSPYVNISPFAKAFRDRRDLIHRAGVMGQLAAQTAPSFALAWAERAKIPMPGELVEAVKSLRNQIADWKTLYDEAAARVERLQDALNEERAAHVAALSDHSEFISRMRTERDKLDETYKKLISVGDERIAHQKAQIQDLTKRIAELEAAPPANEAKPLHTRERDSLLKLIIGMAIGGYGFNPQTARSPTAKDIADDLARAGLSLDQDTVRKYLAEAKELLPGGETEQNR